MSKSLFYPFNQIKNENKISLNESPENKNEPESEKKDLFTILYPKKIFSFLNKRKLDKSKRAKKINRNGNIRLKIVTNFFNKYLITLLNKILKNNGSHLIFEKFPQKFLMNISEKANKKIMDMTLEEIILNNETYLMHMHNKYIVMKDIYIKELKEVLNKKFTDLFREYLISKEFYYEINRLKNIVDNKYIQKYKYLAEKFIESFHG